MEEKGNEEKAEKKKQTRRRLVDLPKFKSDEEQGIGKGEKKRNWKDLECCERNESQTNMLCLYTIINHRTITHFSVSNTTVPTIKI